MIVDQEWGSLREAWIAETDNREEIHQEDDALARLKLKVKQQGRRLVIRFVLGVTLAVFFLLHSAAMAVFQSDPFTLVWAAAIWVFTLWALGISIRKQRGVWRPEAETTASYVEISIRRCEASLGSIRQGFRLMAWELVFVAAFLTWKAVAGWELSLTGTLGFIGLLAGMATLLSVNMITKARRLRAELAEWLDFEKSTAS
jgi:hypothetical protein